VCEALLEPNGGRRQWSLRAPIGNYLASARRVYRGWRVGGTTVISPVVKLLCLFPSECLQQPEFLHRIPLLKTQVRLKQHDALWRHICEELDWPFRPTKRQRSPEPHFGRLSNRKNRKKKWAALLLSFGVKMHPSSVKKRTAKKLASVLCCFLAHFGSDRRVSQGRNEESQFRSRSRCWSLRAPIGNCMPVPGRWEGVLSLVSVILKPGKSCLYSSYLEYQCRPLVRA